MIGLTLGAARAYRIPVVSQVAAVYVEVIRNTPILVQIFMLFYALPQIGIRLDAFTVAWLAVTIWGGAFNTENFRAGFEAVPTRYREAGTALGFKGFATFVNITLPIGGRIALPSSINTYISIVKNTSLMYVIAYPEITTTIFQIQALTLRDGRGVHRARAHVPDHRLVPLGAHSTARVAPGSPGGSPMSTPDWVEPVARYMLEVGLRNTLKLSAIALVGSSLIGIVLGTLLTVRFLPLRAIIRAYVEIWRGLPILVTIFIVYFALPSVSPTLRFDSITAGAIALILWGSAQVAETTRGAVQSIPREQHEAAAALGFGWVGRHAFVIMPQALRRLLPPLVGLLVNIIQNTTIVQVIGAPELLESAERQVERLTFEGDQHAIQIYGAVMVIFFIISFPLTRLAAYLERRLA